MSLAFPYLCRLTSHPHRGSATAAEAAAARDLEKWLIQLGFAVELQPFRAPRDTLYLGPAFTLLAEVAAAGVGLWSRWLGLLLSLLVLAPMVGEMLGSRLDFDTILPKYPSQNVIARRAARGGQRRTLVISAHYDTQRASLLFHPRFAPRLQAYFYFGYIGLALIPLGIALRQPAVLGAGALLSLANATFLLICRATGGYINGANDNGTGVALALALAERLAADPLPETELIILLTGCEEVGTRGMKRFLRDCALDRATTVFLNLDNLGGGRLTYLTGEGMIRPRPYSPRLRDHAERVAKEIGMAVAARGNLLLPTDGLVPSLAGYEALSFLAFEPGGALPDYHWYTDRLDRVDQELLAATEFYLEKYIRSLGHAQVESS